MDGLDAVLHAQRDDGVDVQVRSHRRLVGVQLEGLIGLVPVLGEAIFFLGGGGGVRTTKRKTTDEKRTSSNDWHTQNVQKVRGGRRKSPFVVADRRPTGIPPPLTLARVYPDGAAPELARGPQDAGGDLAPVRRHDLVEGTSRDPAGRLARRRREAPRDRRRRGMMGRGGGGVVAVAGEAAGRHGRREDSGRRRPTARSRDRDASRTTMMPPQLR
jgi:hypothetical protein